jgi:hypothetical protein
MSHDDGGELSGLERRLYLSSEPGPFRKDLFPRWVLL